jgi:hypothetical protein
VVDWNFLSLLGLLAEITSSHLLRKLYGGVSWNFSWWNGLQLGFELINLGEVSIKYAFYSCNECLWQIFLDSC